MAQISIDLDGLDALGNQWSQSTDEVGAIASDLRNRLGQVDFAILSDYGVDPGLVQSDADQCFDSLTGDSIRLERATSELRRQLWQGLQVEGQSGNAAYSAALPDLWWFKSNQLAATGPVPAGHTEVAAASVSLPAPPLATAVLPAASADPTTVVATSTPGASTGVAAPASVGLPVLSAGAGQIRSEIVTTSEDWIGIPYLWGGGHGSVVAARDTNVDCSGLVHQVFGENGISIGGTAQDMYNDGTPVSSLAQAQPGDLLFWGTPTDIHHVAIYIGDGEMIEAPHTGAFVHEVPVYGGDFAGIRSVLGGS